MILAVANATAQDTFVVFENETRVYSIDEHTGNTYQWSVFDQADLTTEITSTSIVEFVSGKDSYQTEINWKQAGDYVLVAEEFGTCQNLKAVIVSVVTSGTIAFIDLTSTDCADEDNGFATELVAMFDSGTELPESQYPITVYYRLDGDTEDKTATIEYADKMFTVVGIIEDENTETINNITIVSATNKYGGTLTVVSGEDIHTRTIFALPAQPIITVTN
jgi:hypothetical protein